MTRPRLATVSLCGCFGCHMSLLDLDKRILELAAVAEFHRSPLMDRKRFEARCAVGLVEGGCANEENVHVLRDFRRNCDHLVSVGDCATMGGVPAMRNPIPLAECLEASYEVAPDDPEIPRLLDRVYPAHEVVKIDWLLPGCPPSPDALWSVIHALLDGREPDLPKEHLRYD